MSKNTKENDKYIMSNKNVDIDLSGPVIKANPWEMGVKENQYEISITVVFKSSD